jgi:hypothetical protein
MKNHRDMDEWFGKWSELESHSTLPWLKRKLI